MTGKVSLIAEFCQNHNGKPDLLARMVEAAANGGATHGKIQHIYAHQVTFRPQFENGLIHDGKVKAIRRPYRDEVTRLRGLELPPRVCRDFIRWCKDCGLVPMTTCFSRDSVPGIAELGFKVVKVASYDCASFHMLRELKAVFPQLLVSTGATYDDELDHAASILSGHDFAFLHCVTIYPTPFDEMHLARLNRLRRLAPRIGFSDHSAVAHDGVLASKIAIHLGAEIIERHFTILGPAETRDGALSIGPRQCAELVEFSSLEPVEQVRRLDNERPEWRRAIGNEWRRFSAAELLNRDYYRGRFASRRPGCFDGEGMIYNWEETPLQ